MALNGGEADPRLAREERHGELAGYAVHGEAGVQVQNAELKGAREALGEVGAEGVGEVRGARGSAAGALGEQARAERLRVHAPLAHPPALAVEGGDRAGGGGGRHRLFGHKRRRRLELRHELAA